MGLEDKRSSAGKKNDPPSIEPTNARAANKIVIVPQGSTVGRYILAVVRPVSDRFIKKRE